VRVDLTEQPRHPPPSIRIHHQEVDDVGPVLTVLVAVVHQTRGDLIAVGLVADQDVAEVLASCRREHLQQRAKVGTTLVARDNVTLGFQTRDRSPDTAYPVCGDTVGIRTEEGRGLIPTNRLPTD
jgi:hypothetical protein